MSGARVGCACWLWPSSHVFASAEFATSNPKYADYPLAGQEGYLLGAGPELVASPASGWRLSVTPSFDYAIWDVSGLDNGGGLGLNLSVQREVWKGEEWSIALRGEFLYAHIFQGFDTPVPGNGYSGALQLSFAH